MQAVNDNEFEDRTAHLLKLASKATARALQDRLAAIGVSYGHWTLLRILWKKDGLSVTELARRASVAKPAVVTAIQGMEKAGYVTRRRMDGNLKAVYLHLTPLGAKLESQLVPLAIEVNRIILEGIGKQQEASLRKMLITVIRNLDRSGD